MMRILDSKRLSTFFNSLRFQLMLYFIVISLVVLTVGSYLTFRNMLEMLEKRNQTLVLQQFELSEQNILNLIREVDRLSGLYLLDDAVQDFFVLDEYAFIFENVEMVWQIQRSAGDIFFNYPYIDSFYLFTKNREVIGASNNTSLTIRKDQKEHPFFSTVMYEAVNEADIKSRWYGSYTKGFFNEALNLNTYGAEYLVTQVKGVRTVLSQSINGVLALNIDERYLYSLYGKLGDSKKEDTYIVDGNGKILSGGDGSTIGTTSDLFTEIDKAQSYGSNTLRDDQNPRQIIYYKLKSLDWYIIKSVPLQIDDEYAFLLQRTFIITLFLSIFAIFIVSFFWLKRITKPLNKLAGKMADVGQGNIGLTLKHIPKNELGVVIGRFNEMSVNIAELIEKNKEMEKDKRELEIEALQAQINPHFLYNTLNMIRWMATVIKANNIVDCLIALGNILQPVFKNGDTMCRVQDEITYLENYVKIMNWRFGNGIVFKMFINEELLNYKIPRFILQPLVENSITHGLKNGEGFIEINIKIVEEDQDLLVSITDTGTGILKEKLDEINNLLSGTYDSTMNSADNGIGIFNVNRRIKLYYGDDYGISLESSAEEGTKVLLRIFKIL